MAHKAAEEMDRVHAMNLAMIRKAGQMTQVEVAKKLGVGQGMVSQLGPRSWRTPVTKDRSSGKSSAPAAVIQRSSLSSWRLAVGQPVHASEASLSGPSARRVELRALARNLLLISLSTLCTIYMQSHVR
jgi:hypothetical protein